MGYADSMNLYQYCGNSPLNWIDPYGLKIRVYSSDAFGVKGINHAYVRSTETGLGKGMYGSSGVTGGDGVSKPENSPYEEYDIDELMRSKDGKCDTRSDREKEKEFMDNIKKYPDWNQGFWRPFFNDCHNQLERAFEYYGYYYPGVPNGRVDIDDAFRNWLKRNKNRGRN